MVRVPVPVPVLYAISVGDGKSPSSPKMSIVPLVLSAHLVIAITKPIPAWRALQITQLPEGLASRGRLRGAPPCLATLQKVGQGHEAAWRLGSYRRSGVDIDLAFDVNLALDKNPAEPCCKLQFVASPDMGVRMHKIGHMLLASGTIL